MVVTLQRLSCTSYARLRIDNPLKLINPWPIISDGIIPVKGNWERAPYLSEVVQDQNIESAGEIGGGGGGRNSRDYIPLGAGEE